MPILETQCSQKNNQGKRSKKEHIKRTYCHDKLRKGEYQIIKSFLVYNFDVNERKKGNNSEKNCTNLTNLKLKTTRRIDRITIFVEHLLITKE